MIVKGSFKSKMFLSRILPLALSFILFMQINAWSKLEHSDLYQDLVPAKTVGQVWPKPQKITQQATFLTIDAQTFRFVYNGAACEIIDSAISRYTTVIFNPPRLTSSNEIPKQFKNLRTELPNLQISLTGECEIWPYLNMDESYELNVDSSAAPGGAALTAASVWGILRGLETFSQLIYHDEARNFYINSTEITDFPRFSFRGILLDTSRHFVSLGVLKDNLDAMAYNKFNVFHWHIVDDQSFPYQSQAFPDISEKGAYNPKTHIYTFDDITSIINYARERGIRVIVEFDTPGHTQSWGPGVPGLLTPCYTGSTPNGDFGPINPIVNSTYDFLYALFSEVTHLFPDAYIHLGGDEVSFSCWMSNPDIQQFMNEQGFTDYSQLESYYINKLLDIIKEVPDNKNYIVWQEVFDNGVELNPDTVVHVWKDGYIPEMEQVTKSGFKTILSSCWYLNYIDYGSDWVDFYKCEPLAFNGTQEQYDLVMGGAGCMWGEWVDGTNLITRTWPRASAVAERLWSDESVTNTGEAGPRLEEHHCRMLERGINAEPFNGPNFCNVDYLI